MEFRIANTFTESFARLTGDEQKAVKITVFDLHHNPRSPGMSFHKLDRTKDKNFCSVRVNADIRLIVHRLSGSMLLCYVGHHDEAYAWAERRRLEVHPKTGAAQLVEIREVVHEINVPRYVSHVADGAGEARQQQPLLFSDATDDDLLNIGVPSAWLRDVRNATESSLLSLVDHLPAEAAEALLEAATGGRSITTREEVVEFLPFISDEGDALEVNHSLHGPPVDEVSKRAFEHPDAKRRFRTVSTHEELQRALDYPWDRWTIFLHPEQREWIERGYRGAARVSGSAGTGKTIVAIHRAAHLARANPNARVLLTTFSDTLARALRVRLRRLLAGEPRLGERIDTDSLPAVAMRLFETHLGKPALVDRAALRAFIAEAATATPGHSFSVAFLLTEWEQVVDAWQLDRWEAYRDIVRLGRKTRLAETQRRVLWTIFERVRGRLAERKQITWAELYTALAAKLGGTGKVIYDSAIIDESQDLSVAQLRFLAALGGKRPNGLFFAGDLGQRIFQAAFSWKTVGIDVRGRSRTLRVNYRTSHQIRTQADRLLAPAMTDVDGNAEDRSATVSVFNGPAPTICSYESEEAEIEAVGRWLADQAKSGVEAHEIGLFVRSVDQLDRAVGAAKRSTLSYRVLDEELEATSGYVSIGTMHLAKGLEFRSVAVMACDDEIVPLQARIEAVGDDSDLREVYDTERHLLYVACTRARDRLLVTSVKPSSEFLDDLTGNTGAPEIRAPAT